MPVFISRALNYTMLLLFNYNEALTDESHENLKNNFNRLITRTILS